MTGNGWPRPGARLRGAAVGAADLEQPFDGDSLYALRAAVAAHGSQAGLSDGRTRDLVLVVHELAANAVRHGAGHGRLRMWTTPDEVRCEVTDSATGSPAADGPLPEGPAPEGPAAAGSTAGTVAADAAALWQVEPGHGLWLVRRVADQASVRSGPSGTVAGVSFRLDGLGMPAPFGLAQHADRGCIILAITGQLDLGSAGDFGGAVDELIASAPGVRLVLDLTLLSGWDSSGLAALITAQHRVNHDHHAQMILAGLPGPLVQRLREAGLDSRFTLADSLAAAVEALTSPR
jgi:anti-anti-sigma factor